MKSTSKSTYLRTLLILFCAYFFLSALIVWAVDPFNEFGRNKVGLFFSTDRQAHKDIADLDHNAISIGSSKTEIPKKMVSQIDCYDFYSASIKAVMIEEMYQFLKRYTTDEEMILIGLDFYMFNERQWPLMQLNDWPDHQFGFLEYLTSFNALKSSFIALYKSQNNINDQSLIDSIVDEGWVENSSNRTGTKRAENTLAMLSRHHYRRYQFSQERMEYIKEIALLLEERGHDYMFYTNPMSEPVCSMIMSSENRQVFMEWKDRLKALLGDKFVDFSCEKYTSVEYYDLNDDDLYHFSHAVGIEILNSLLTCKEKVRHEIF